MTNEKYGNSLPSNCDEIAPVIVASEPAGLPPPPGVPGSYAGAWPARDATEEHPTPAIAVDAIE